MTDDEGDGESTSHDEQGDGAADAPLSDLASRRRARREERESAGPDADDPFSTLARDAEADPPDDALPGDDPAGDSDSAFEQMDVEPVDSEDVWSDLLEDRAEPAETAGTTETVDVTDAGDAEAPASVDVESVPVDADPVDTAGVDADGPDPTAVGTADAGEGVDPREEHVIPKADYCQQCAYFSDPPEVACGNEGTDIVSVEDFEHFRVRGCPVVENEFKPGDGNY